MNIPSRPAALETEEQEDPRTGDEREDGEEQLLQGVDALGCVSPLRESTRQKWEASVSRDSQKEGLTVEALEKRLAEAEARREKFKKWMLRADEEAAASSTGARIKRARDKKESALNSRREHYRMRIDRLMEGARVQLVVTCHPPLIALVDASLFVLTRFVAARLDRHSPF